MSPPATQGIEKGSNSRVSSPSPDAVVGGALGRLASQLEGPLWGAELDHGITRAITLLEAQEQRDTSGERRRVALALDATITPELR